MTDKLNRKLDQLAEAWNAAEIARPSLGRWLDQFDAGDQAIALRLLDCCTNGSAPTWSRTVLTPRLAAALRTDASGGDRRP